MSIRPLEPQHCDAVLRINASAGAAVFRLDARELSRLMAISASHTVACGEDGSVLGYALAFPHESRYDGEEFLAFRSLIDEPFLYIDQVAVDSRARGTGLGRRLYEELARSAERGAAKILCCEVNTLPPNPASMGFHSRMGFRPMGALSTADGRSVALLRQDLDR